MEALKLATRLRPASAEPIAQAVSTDPAATSSSHLLAAVTTLQTAGVVFHGRARSPGATGLVLMATSAGLAEADMSP